MSAEWTPANSHAAMLEGWDIFQTDSEGHDPYELEFLQEPGLIEGLGYDQPKFTADPEVWAHVRDQAWMGSELHQRALLFLEEHSPGEFKRVRDYKPPMLSLKLFNELFDGLTKRWKEHRQ